MDSNEFRTWSKRLRVLFPRFSDWLDKLDVDTRNEMSSEWERALSRVEFVDCMESLSDVYSGDAEAFNQWEYGTWVAHIRRLAIRKREDRESSLRSNQPLVWEETGGHKVSLGGVYRMILAVRDAGGDVQTELSRLLPVDELSGPRFSCWMCQDVGFVTVWHLVSMRAVEKGDELTARNRKVMTTLCNCENGRKKITPEGSKRIYWTERHLFDPQRHLLCPNGLMDEAAERELREFVAEMAQKQLESRPNYSPALAAFNKGSI